MPEITLTGWFARSASDPYTPPEARRIELVGHVTGHPRFPAGARIATGPIISAEGRYVHTTRTTYYLGPASEDYVRWLKESNIPHDPDHPVRVEEN